jgi:ubiquinone/menaquinone biosynthesis C-methylase UbiE
MKHGDPPKMWQFVSGNLKESARNWFIHRAEKAGVPWHDITNSFKNDMDILEFHKTKYEDTTIQYPSYYTQPFHGYDLGNLEWNAAVEAAAATLSISATYWDNTDAITAEQWMRYNATDSIKNYVYHHIHRPVHNILDMGCATGISTNYVHNAFPKSNIVGVDLSPYFISTAVYSAEIMNQNIQFMHANVEKIPLVDEGFDMITCNFLFHEMPYEATVNVLKEAHRLLKTDGVLAIVDLNPFTLKKHFNENKFRLWAFEATEPHIYEYYRHDMKITMEECGFESIMIKENDPLNLVWMGKKGGVKIKKSLISTSLREAQIPSRPLLSVV